MCADTSVCPIFAGPVTIAQAIQAAGKKSEQFKKAKQVEVYKLTHNTKSTQLCDHCGCKQDHTPVLRRNCVRNVIRKATLQEYVNI